jgi:ribokinase
LSLFVVGALHWDVIVESPRFPQLDETLKGQSVTYRLGGKGGNQALAAARAGASVAFAGRVGADEPGRAIRNELTAAGIKLSQLQQGSGATGMSVAISISGGDYGAVIVSGENERLDVSAIAPPSDCRLLLLQNELPPRLGQELTAQARAAGLPVWLNAAPAGELPAAALHGLDTLVVNRVEASALTALSEDSPPEVLLAALQARVPETRIVVTLGATGLVFAAPGAPPQLHRTRAVSGPSHGAGDCFLGTLAAAYLSRQDFSAALDSAQRASAAHIAQARPAP